MADSKTLPGNRRFGRAPLLVKDPGERERSTAAMLALATTFLAATNTSGFAKNSALTLEFVGCHFGQDSDFFNRSFVSSGVDREGTAYESILETTPNSCRR